MIIDTSAISFERPHNESRPGHIRRFSTEGYMGMVVFKFEGEREDRQFYLQLCLNGLNEAKETYVGAETASELVDIMHDDESLAWVIEQAVYDATPHRVGA